MTTFVSSRLALSSMRLDWGHIDRQWNIFLTTIFCLVKCIGNDIGNRGCHPSTFPLPFFFTACCRFFSRRLRIDALLGRVAIRGRFLRRRAASFSSSRAMARCRFWWRERDSVAVTTIPDGRCVMRTPVSLVLRCWPPGPEPRKKSMRISCAFIFNPTIYEPVNYQYDRQITTARYHKRVSVMPPQRQQENWQ